MFYTISHLSCHIICTATSCGITIFIEICYLCHSKINKVDLTYLVFLVAFDHYVAWLYVPVVDTVSTLFVNVKALKFLFLIIFIILILEFEIPVKLGRVECIDLVMEEVDCLKKLIEYLIHLLAIIVDFVQIG